MTLSNYKWQDAEQQFMSAVDSELGSVAFPALEQNRYYAEFLASKATAAPYVAPPPPAPMTTEQKVDQLLSDYGLTRNELRAALSAKATKK